MPYLMLDFEHDQSAAKYRVPSGGNKGELRESPNKKHMISMRMIDTDTGKIVELYANAYDVKHEEREPTWGETHTAGQVLGKDPGRAVESDELKRLRNENAKLQQKIDSSESAVNQKTKIIEGLEAEIASMRERDFNPETRSLLAAALDVHIEEMAMGDQDNFERYEKAKKLYRALTGKSWVGDDDDLGDDDEEDD